MLFAMTLNGYVIISVISGISIGYSIFTVNDDYLKAVNGNTDSNVCHWVFIVLNF